MATQINLGSMFQSGGKTVISGGNSGLDTEKLITDLVKARSIPIDLINTRKDTNSKKLTALNELSSIMDKIKFATDFLRNAPGIGKESSNVFQYRTTSLSATGGVAGTSYLDISAKPGADLRVSDIEVLEIAKARVQTSAVINVADAATSVVGAAAAPNRFTAGVLELNNGVNVTLEDGDSLSTIAQKINATSATSNVQATVIKVATGQYSLQLKATKTGMDADFDLNVPANNGAGAPLENIAFGDTQLAKNAQISLDGVVITSQSNVISDAIEGVTFSLKQKTNGETITAEIKPDTEVVKNAITSLVDAYNELRVFMAVQTERDENGDLKETALLANNSTLRTVMNRVDEQINRVVGGLTADAPSKLADLGISFTDFAGDDENPAVRNVLTIDEQKLSNILASDFDGVRRIFEFDFKADNENIMVFSRSNQTTLTNFTLTIDSVAGTATAFDGTNSYNLTYTPYTDTLGAIVGANLTGEVGTPLEGLMMIYASTDDATMNVNMTQGIGDSLFNSSEDVLNKTSGILGLEAKNFQDTNKRYDSDIAKLNRQIEEFRQNLLRKFTALEQAISNVNTLLQSLDAQTNAQNNQ